MKDIKYQVYPLFYRSGLVFIWINCSMHVLSMAQSDNYWSWNLNTPSTLLAGSVVGGSAGPSAVYYNPALIDHENVPSFSLSASIVSLQFFKAHNFVGNGIDVDNTILKVQPKFLSYVLPSKNDRLGMEAAILSPVSEEMNFRVQHFDELDIIRRTQGNETYSGYLNYSRKYDDTWGGFGLSYKLNEQVYIGLSSFISYKSMDYEYKQRAEAFQEGDSVLINQSKEAKYIALSSFEEEANYWDVSLVFKGGIQYKSKNERLSIGANLTFQNIPLFGQAAVRKSLSRSNVYDNSTDAFTPNDIFIEFEENASSRVKTPFSSAIGLIYFSGNRRNIISFTLEYFHDIDPYAIIDVNREVNNGGTYLDKNIDKNEFLSYYHSANSVTNAGIGFQKYISPALVFLGGFRTDFTSGKEDDIRVIQDKFKFNQIHMDKYHISLGPVINIKQFNGVIGIQYTFARNNDLSSIINYAEPVEFIPQTGQALKGERQNTTEASIDEISIFFGLTVDIIK